MVKVKKSDYIKYSRTIVGKLYSQNCFGKGSLYEETICTGVPDKAVAKEVLKALCKQKIVLKKKKKRGWKYYLDIKKLDKIKQIVKETGRTSIIPLILCL